MKIKNKFFLKTFCILFAVLILTSAMTIDAWADGARKISESKLTENINNAKAGSTIYVNLKTTDNLTVPASIYRTLANSDNKGKKLQISANNENNQSIYRWVIDNSKTELYSDTEYTDVNLKVDFNCKVVNAIKRHIGTEYKPFYFTVSPVKEPNALWIPSTLSFIPASSWRNNNNMNNLYLYRYDAAWDKFYKLGKTFSAASNGRVNMKFTHGGYFVLTDREIIAKEPFIMINELSFHNPPKNLKVGDKNVFVAVAWAPCSAQNNDMIYTSSNTNVIRFPDANWANFDCVGAGTATVTAKNPMSGISASYTFTVSENTEASKDSVTSTDEMTDDEKALAKEVAELVNKERVAAGLSELNYSDSLLNKAAAIRSREMKDAFSHDRPDGSDCFSVFSQIGLDYYNKAGENIASGYATADAVMNGWMNSPGHRANILTHDFDTIGIGVFIDGDTKWWVQMFLKTN